MTSWKLVHYLRKGETDEYEHVIALPEPLASWDTFSYWERERTHSLQEHLTETDVLYDVGAEHGWLSVVYAKFCKVFLIEPTPEFWPNIYHTWHRNVMESPAGCFCGLIGDKSNCKPTDFGWPEEHKGELINKNKYLYLDHYPEGTQVLTIDDLVEISGVKPTALTIDVEGWETLVLKGARKLLTENSVKVWVSVHPDLASKIGIKDNEVADYMNGLGYTGQLLAVDHEAHWYYAKK